MKLYYIPGACSLASHITLRELGLDFDLDKVDLETRQTESGENFLTVNPEGYVPALAFDDGKVLTEGAAILQYLADRHPEMQLAPPPGTWERAQLHRLLNFTSTELHKSFVPLFYSQDETERQAAIAKIGKRFNHIEDLLSDGRPYLMGETYTVADPYLFTVVSWTVRVSMDLSPWPNLKAYVERIGGRDATRKAAEAEGLREAV